MRLNEMRSVIRMLILESETKVGHKMIFLAGLPGGGKSTLLRQLGIEGQFTNCNIDNFFEPRLMDALGTKNLHAYSERFFRYREIRDVRPLTPEEQADYDRTKALRKDEWNLFLDSINQFKRQVKEVCAVGSNFIVDGTAANYKGITADARRFQDGGYDCAMIFVDIDAKTSKQRNIKRGEEGGRAIYTGIIDDQAQRLPGHLGPYKQFFGEDRFFLVSNRGSFDEYQANIELIRPGVQAFMEA